jgi:hypothetical protein
MVRGVEVCVLFLLVKDFTFVIPASRSLLSAGSDATTTAKVISI